PADADARREVPPFLVQAGRSRRKARVAGVDEPRRRVVEYRALDVLPEPVAVEDRVRTTREVLAEERLPPDARVDRHPSGRAPRVLRVDALIPLVVIDAGQPRLIDRGDAPEEHVRQSQSCRLAGEGPLSAAARPRPERHPEVGDARADA